MTAHDADVRTVLEYVSRGRRFVDVEPYPDFQARRALGALADLAGAAERLRRLAAEFRSRSDQSVVDALSGEPAEDECDSPAECHGAAACWTWKLAARQVEKLAESLSASTAGPEDAVLLAVAEDRAHRDSGRRHPLDEVLVDLVTPDGGCHGCGSTRIVTRSRRAYCTEPTCDRRLPGPPCETCTRPRALHVCLSCSPDELTEGPGVRQLPEHRVEPDALPAARRGTRHRGDLVLNVEDRHPAVREFRDMFDFEHLKGLPREVSATFAEQAQRLVDTLPDAPPLTRALHRLWESKNEAVFLAVRVTKEQANA